MKTFRGFIYGVITSLMLAMLTVYRWGDWFLDSWIINQLKTEWSQNWLCLRIAIVVITMCMIFDIAYRLGKGIEDKDYEYNDYKPKS